MTYTFRPARREKINLLIGLCGGTGSGKTLSALMLARGLAGDSRFCLIDTEAGRGRQYAPIENEKPSDFVVDFDYTELAPPFTPRRYLEAIKAADAAGYPVIIVDSMSHEYAGTGGLLDMHDAELSRIAGNDAKRREAATFAAWVRPKMEHKSMVAALLQLRAHLVLCFRAEEKVDIVKEDGKLKVVPKKTLTGLDGWVPICEKTLPYELTASLLFKASRPGVPEPIKLIAAHRPLFEPNKTVNADHGRALAAWARGDAAEPTQTDQAISIDKRGQDAIIRRMRNAQTLDELDELADFARELPEERKEEVRDAYAARRDALRGAN